MTLSNESADVEARLRALEAVAEIRQLAARYALALDSRDIDTLVSLFVDDVRTGDGGVGREALASWFDRVLRCATTTFHLIGNHVVDLVDDDHATGTVYCRPEHEVGELWVVMPLLYSDRYQRRDGRWYFRSRRLRVFYAADVLENPAQLAGRFHFPGNPMVTRADLPESWPTWQAFWAGDKAEPA